mmetsp:Transcript_28670/g.32125  ORF Transcript_28670/g.32125 Transcript_28670/m.32125 type:complete len:90 (+) Transcript_28670:734-1003(+)
MTSLFLLVGGVMCVYVLRCCGVCVAVRASFFSFTVPSDPIQYGSVSMTHIYLLCCFPSPLHWSILTWWVEQYGNAPMKKKISVKEMNEK